MPYRNPDYLKLAKGKPCVNCGKGGSTVAAHSNSQALGKGMGIKANDFAVAFLCQACHKLYDTGGMPLEYFLVAILKTQQMLLDTGEIEIHVL